MFKKFFIFLLLTGIMYGQLLMEAYISKKGDQYYKWKNRKIIQIYEVVDPKDRGQDKLVWEYNLWENHPFKSFPDSVPARWVHEKIIAHNPTRLTKDSVLQGYYQQWLQEVERNSYLHVKKEQYEDPEKFYVGEKYFREYGYLVLSYRLEFETKYSFLRASITHLKILNENGIFKEITLYDEKSGGTSIDAEAKYVGYKTSFPLKFEDYDEEWYIRLDQMYKIVDIETGETVYSYQDYGYVGGYFTRKIGAFRNVWVIRKSLRQREDQWYVKFIIVDLKNRKAYHFPNIIANKRWKIYSFDNNVFVLTNSVCSRLKSKRLMNKIKSTYSKTGSKSSVKEIARKYYPTNILEIFDQSDMTVEEF